MPIVTLLERQKKNAERVNVYLDGEFAFGLNEMDAAQLRKGQVLDEAEIVLLHHKDAISKAVERAVNLLSYRPRSQAEVRERLLQAEFDEAVTEAALNKLQTLGYLDDRQFARFWIEERNRFKPAGERALRYELRQKGVDDALIAELLAELLDEDQAAYEAALPRVRRMRGASQREFKQKIGAFLQRRGFNYDVANRALQTLIEELQSDDPHFFAGAAEDWDESP